MSETAQKVKKTGKLTKKQARKEVATKLSGALEEYKNKLGEKKFATSIKKATKLFAVDLARASKKNLKAVKVVKETVKK